MARLVAFTAAFAATAWLTGAASAHPGHETPHLLHEADTWVGWWAFLAACATTGAWALARRRS